MLLEIFMQLQGCTLSKTRLFAMKTINVKGDYDICCTEIPRMPVFTVGYLSATNT